MTKTDYAMEWRDAGRPSGDWRCKDGTSLLLYVTLDFDYDMAYLLRVEPNDGTVTWLAIRQKHAPYAGDESYLETEWMLEANKQPFFEQTPWEAIDEFLAWAHWTMTEGKNNGSKVD